ncbi:MerR family transcriptional regulator [Pseudonocardia eucalypti]|uniref:MerR family transcriptional regulator n=1 Tax=Pseudonocardia eucalypti TaxID=648755 RepID=A0ABP9PG46_9PSEU|nr:DNA-binding transcriptional MerR regulator [Pseudonocardia eucalypti]
MTTTASEQTDNDAGLLTIDQLSGRSGVSVRTIRFYSGKGLLPPPTLRGRLGLYGPQHIARLELISELTAMGYTLAAVEGFLAKLPADADTDALALQRALLVPWVAEQPEELSLLELNRRVGRTLTEDELEALDALGVLELRPGGSIVMRGSQALETALVFIGTGVPLAHLQSLRDAFEKHMDALVHDLLEAFQNQVLQPYRDRGRPVAERARLREQFNQMKPLAVQGVVNAFARAMTRQVIKRYKP